MGPGGAVSRALSAAISQLFVPADARRGDVVAPVSLSPTFLQLAPREKMYALEKSSSHRRMIHESERWFDLELDPNMKAEFACVEFASPASCGADLASICHKKDDFHFYGARRCQPTLVRHCPGVATALHCACLITGSRCALC